MTHLRIYAAVTATAAALALGQNAFAQDDLNDLLAEFDGKPAKQAAAKEEKSEEAPAAETAAAPVVETAPAAAPTAEPTAAADTAAEAPAAAAPAAGEAAEAPRKDAELIDEIRTTEQLRREAMDVQAMREIDEARASMVAGEYTEAVRHYSIAIKLLNDRPGSKVYKDECNEGIAEGLYQAALEEDRTGRRDRAIKLISKAVDMRHPKARRQLEAWNSEIDPDKYKTDVSEISHRRNETEYKTRRESERQRLKRARQLLAQREIDRALDECELVLVGDPYNQEALRLRDSIQRKREVILKQERKVAREAWIADVDEAWRPPYAIDARDLDDKGKGKTIRKQSEDGERTIEQTIVQRMKDMRLPAISFKPPATIIDAVEYFRGASKDFDRPDIPIEKRGFNFVLKTPEAVHMQANNPNEDSDDFSDTGANDAGGAGPLGVPVIPMITASDISFFDALKLVCDSVDYKFSVQGPIVMVMHKSMSTDELVLRKYSVLATITEKMSNAREDITTMQSGGFGGGASKRQSSDEGEENQERDWKEFFHLLGGVEWPEGSTISYVKTVGKLFVNNTQENLAKLEAVLAEIAAPVTLIEIETRFVEVCQDDLNSLGFEWILNGDYTLGLNRHIAKALGIRDGAWGVNGSSRWQQGSEKQRYWQYTTTTSGGNSGTEPSGDNPVTGTPNSSSASTQPKIERQILPVPSGSGRTDWKHWSASDRNPWSNRSSRNVGVGAFGGEGSNYSTGERYLSTIGNHISGESKSTNDQFMKLNAFLGQADLSMILHMLSQRSDTDLLSAPKVLTKQGEEATMKVVTEYIYPTDYDVQLQSSSSGGGYGGSSSQSAILAVVEPQSFTMREVGVILQVTPTLTDEGNVIDLELRTDVVDEPTWKNYGMKIPFTGNSSTSVPSLAWLQALGQDAIDAVANAVIGIVESDPAPIANKYLDAGIASMNPGTITYYDAPMEQPFFHVRSVESKLSVYPGATIIMGGLITEARKAMDDKIPFLGDIPFIGRLFRSHSEQTSKRNLLIFVTTRLVDGDGRVRKIDQYELAEQGDGVKAAPEADAD